MITAAFVLALLNLAAASTQMPWFTPCSGNPDDDVITTSDVTVYNAVVGDLMTVEYTMDVSEEIDDDPLVAFEMSSGDSRLPCYENFGSCTYSMCDGTSDVAKQIGAPWNNSCPIAPGSYHNYLNIMIPSRAKFFIMGSKLHIKVQNKNNKDELGCGEFDITVQGA